MNFSGSQCIAKGPRAGMPRPEADQLLDQEAALRRALVVLKKNGFQPFGATLGVGATPHVTVQPNAATRRLIETEQGNYYAFGNGFRKGHAWLDGVRVTWTEERTL